MPPFDPEEPASLLRQIPILENGEPLVSILEHSPRIFWVPRHPVFEYHRYSLARLTVAQMLDRAAAALPDGLRLAVVEGWRPPEIQRQMHEATRNRLRREHPDWDAVRLQREVERFSAPMDDHAPPPHTTGGAVDVHLIGPDDQPLDLTSPYDLLDGRAAPMSAEGLSETARGHRALLARAMAGAGFTNYAPEFWHWSYGDQSWAYRGGHPSAIYGAVDPPETVDSDFNFSTREDPGY